MVRYLIPGIVLFCVAAVWYSPSWWEPAPSDDPLVLERASAFEQQISSRIHQIRTTSDPWGFKVDETLVNEWLATRLPRWIDHDDELQWPPGISRVQVHFSPGEIEVAGQGAVGLVWRARFGVDMVDGSIRFTPRSAGVGAIPGFGVGLKGVLKLVPEGVLDEQGAIEMPGELVLVDGRILRLEDLEVSSGGLALLFLSEPRGEVGQK